MRDYDEILTENPFFVELKQNNWEVYEKAVLEGWSICIPRAGSLDNMISLPLILRHVLVPNEDLPETHFSTLDDQQVRLASSPGPSLRLGQASVAILFVETCYNEDMRRHKLLCLDGPLVDPVQLDKDRLMVMVGGGSSPLDGYAKAKWQYEDSSVESCLKFIAEEVGGPDLVAKIFKACQTLKRTWELQVESSSPEWGPTQWPPRSPIPSPVWMADLQTSYQNVLSEASRLPHVEARLLSHRRAASAENCFRKRLVSTVEATVLHHLYQPVISMLSSEVLLKDSQLNKALQGVRLAWMLPVGEVDHQDLSNNAVRNEALSELFRLVEATTPATKLAHLVETIHLLFTTAGTDKKRSSAGGSQQEAAGTDQLLPAFVDLVARAQGVTNWYAQLEYMSNLRLVPTANPGGDAALFNGHEGFCLATLEAALEFLRSGGGSGGHHNRGGKEVHGAIKSSTGVLKAVQAGDLAEVYRLIKLETDARTDVSPAGSAAVAPSEQQTCHPLCQCCSCSGNPDGELSGGGHGCEAFTVISPLQLASLKGDSMMVELLLKFPGGAQKLYPWPWPSSGARSAGTIVPFEPLHLAAASGHRNVVVALLGQTGGPIVSILDKAGNSALHLAAANGHVTCVEAILRKAITDPLVDLQVVDLANAAGDTPLHLSCRMGFLDVVRVLLKHGADPGKANKANETPVDLVLDAGLKKFLRTAARRDRTGSRTIAAISSGSSSSGSSSFSYVSDGEAVDADFGVIDEAEVREVGGDDEVVDPQDATLRIDRLFRAVETEDLFTVSLYLGLAVGLPYHQDQLDPSLDRSLEIYRDGLTPLHTASLKGSAPLTRLLLEQGASPMARTRNRSKETALHLSVRGGHLQVADTILMMAGGDAERLQLLTSQDREGNTPLHRSILEGRGPDMASLLIAYGAEPEGQRNRDQNSAMDLALESGDDDMISVLLDLLPQ